MDVSVEAISEVERSLTIELPASDIDGLVEQRLKEAARSVRINGFRPGKAPLREVKRRYGESVRVEVISKAIDDSFAQALQTQAIAPASAPSIEILQNQAGSAFQYKATVEVFPEIELNSLDCLQVKKPIVAVEESDIDDVIEKLRRDKATWEEKTSPAAHDDKLIIDYSGTIAGEAFAGGSDTDAALIIGSNDWVSGFEDQLIGVSAGDEVTVHVEFPEDYQNEALQGKAAEFAVVVRSIHARKLPELDEAFLKEMQIEGGDVDAFRQALRDNMTSQLTTAVENAVKSQVFEELLKYNPLTVPKSSVRREMERQRDEMVRQAARQFRMPAEQIADMFSLEMFREQAERSVKVALLLQAYIRANDIQADDERVDAEIRKMFGNHSDADMLVSAYRSNEERLEQVRAVVIESLAVEKLLSGADITDNPVSFADAMAGKFGSDDADEAVASDATVAQIEATVPVDADESDA